MYVPPGFATVTPYIFADAAEPLVDAADMPYGDRQGVIRDPAGNVGGFLSGSFRAHIPVRRRCAP